MGALKDRPRFELAEFCK
ncbi:hypothetical protein GWI33_012434, partial [Rhynchophorus ferrugineus]